MNTIVFSTLVSAIATVVIAGFAIANYKLAKNIQQRDKEYRQQTSDLFQAIVISNFLSHPEIDEGQARTDRRIKLFKEKYKGKTPIYLVEEK